MMKDVNVNARIIRLRVVFVAPSVVSIVSTPLNSKVLRLKWMITYDLSTLEHKNKFIKVIFIKK